MSTEDERRIIEEIKPIINGMGYELVEVKVGKSKKLDNITVIIYKKGGVSLNDCANVSRNIKLQLDVIDEFEHIRLQVASPGIDRVIKDRQEYQIFKGKGVKVLLMEKSDWTGGIIENFSGDKLILKSKDKMIDIGINQIKKAKLDYAEEVKNK